MALEGSGVGQITLYPILIKKGSTSIALYGLGNIRDESLNRMFQTPHAVQWMRPESQEGCQVSDWFNILVLHQNRLYEMLLEYQKFLQEWILDQRRLFRLFFWSWRRRGKRELTQYLRGRSS